MEMENVVSRRVDRLEELMAQLTINVNHLSQDIKETKELIYYSNEALQEQTAEVSRDLRTHITNLALEMRQADLRARKANEILREEMREANEASREADEALRQRISDLSQEMKEFKEEMREFKKEGERQRRHLNKKTAEISDKMGTLAEDLIAPSIPRILKTIVKCPQEPEMVGVRAKRHANGKSQEYDVIAMCGDYILICEAKSRLRPEDVRKFRDKLPEAHQFLPEYADKKIIGALGSFYIDPAYIKHGTRMGLIMLGVIDGLMTVLNEDGFVPQAF